MRRPGRQDVLIVITSPAEVEDPGDFTPFDAEQPDDLVFCCFFKELEQRAEFLKRLRDIAARPPAPDEDPAELNAALRREYERLHAEGESGEAFFAAVHWWIGAMRRGYHSYSLKLGFAPYRTSCIVSFRELD